MAVVGPSDSGKTTLFHLIAGLLQPSQGEVRVNDVSLGILRERERDRFRAKTIRYVFQSFNLLPALSALDNVRRRRCAWRHERACDGIVHRLEGACGERARHPTGFCPSLNF